MTAYHIKQKGNADCGIACLKMILVFHGIDIAYEQICRELKFDPLDKEGISMKQISDYLLSFSLKTIAARINRIHLEELIPVPCILFIGGNHFIILWEIGKEFALISDPSDNRPKIILTDLLMNHWLLTKAELNHINKSKKKAKIKKRKPVEGICLAIEFNN